MLWNVGFISVTTTAYQSRDCQLLEVLHQPRTYACKRLAKSYGGIVQEVKWRQTKAFISFPYLLPIYQYLALCWGLGVFIFGYPSFWEYA
eukprot:3952047-Amphidinium_carterae.1